MSGALGMVSSQTPKRTARVRATGWPKKIPVQHMCRDCRYSQAQRSAYGGALQIVCLLTRAQQYITTRIQS